MPFLKVRVVSVLLMNSRIETLSLVMLGCTKLVSELGTVTNFHWNFSCFGALSGSDVFLVSKINPPSNENANNTSIWE